MQRQPMSLDDIRQGLGHVEEWCRVLREAVDHYADDQEIQRPSEKKSDCPPPRAVYADDQHVGPVKKSDCPPPKSLYEA